ncbi:MAG: hypothetical protein JW778_02775 [Candidatus Altiarchaeota archaeon]|nr:hypothetical protein [Candidatus Altiarchaeota archaeon]
MDLTIDLTSFIQDVWSIVLLIMLFIIGYFVGYFVVSNLIKRLLLVEKLQVQLVRYGATTTSMWRSIVDFTAMYATWFVVFFFLALAYERIPFLGDLFSGVVIPLTKLISLIICGLLIGSFVGKLTKDSLVTIGLEDGLARYKIGDTLGGVPVSSVLATIAKWFSFLLFVTEAYRQILVGVGGDSEIINALKGLLNYVPNALLGILVLVVSLIVANFASARIRQRMPSFGELFPTVIEIVIIFFGVVLALPRIFGIDDPTVFLASMAVMAGSFLILMVGVALGLAIAIGLGFKSYAEKAAEKLK